MEIIIFVLIGFMIVFVIFRGLIYRYRQTEPESKPLSFSEKRELIEDFRAWNHECMLKNKLREEEINIWLIENYKALVHISENEKLIKDIKSIYFPDKLRLVALYKSSDSFIQFPEDFIKDIKSAISEVTRDIEGIVETEEVCFVEPSIEPSQSSSVFSFI